MTGLFSEGRSKRIAKVIDITSPSAFQRSIRVLRKDGITLQEKRALVLARTRAAMQLRRKNLSLKERVQMGKIAGMRLPKVSK